MKSEPLRRRSQVYREFIHFLIAQGLESVALLEVFNDLIGSPVQNRRVAGFAKAHTLRKKHPEQWVSFKTQQLILHGEKV
jgi:hypothetical protein